MYYLYGVSRGDKFIETGSRMVVGGERGWLFIGWKFQFCKLKKFERAVVQQYTSL